MTKKKIRLYAIGNDGRFNYYVFDKSNEVIEILSKFFSDIFGIYLNFYEEDTKGKIKEMNFNKLKDTHLGHKGVLSKNVRIDLFFGDKKMFISINCSPKLRSEFNKELEKVSKMPKPKPIKNINSKKKK